MSLAVPLVFSDNCIYTSPLERQKCIAGMAELVDARDSKSRDGDIMGVRFPLPVPKAFTRLN